LRWWQFLYLPIFVCESISKCFNRKLDLQKYNYPIHIDGNSLAYAHTYVTSSFAARFLLLLFFLNILKRSSPWAYKVWFFLHKEVKSMMKGTFLSLILVLQLYDHWIWIKGYAKWYRILTN
jgi:hypothetical protein